MFIQTRPVKLYAIKFITDLAIRSDYASSENLCPFRGMNDVVAKYNSNKETVAGLEMLFEKQMDFDADKIKPTLDEDYIGEASIEDFKEMLHEEGVTIKYSPAIHKLDFPHYFRRIEDIHENYLESYLGNVVFNVRNKSGGIKDFEKEHRDAYVYVDVGDNGEEVTESADLLVGPQISLSEVASVQEALLKLPFVVKRLWSFSKLTKIHVLSYIQSFILAKEANEKARQLGMTTAYLKWNDVIRVGVYQANSSGEVTKLVDVNNKNKYAKEMFDWITDNSDTYKSFYRNYRDFVIYCSVLNIDIRNDDMLSYDKAFIDKLKVTTVTPNDLYDTMVAEAIKSGSVSADANVKKAETTGEDSIYNTIRIFNDFILSSVTEQRKISNMSGLQRQNIENAAKYLYIYYRQKYRGEQVNLSRISWREGFMYYDDEVVRIPLEIIHRDLAEEGSVYNYGLISEIGSFIKLTPTFILQRTMLLDVVNYIKCKDSYVEASIPKWEQVSL